jgi:phosphatidylserine decarboxylase
MKHAGKARKAGFKLIFYSLIALVAFWAFGAFASVIGTIISAIALPFLGIVWVLFALFTLYFFRDPNARPPAGTDLVLSPAHGKVDVIDTTTESQFMGGKCQRVSIFLSVFDVHVQNAPVNGKIAFYQYTEGEFINALKVESALHNENLLLGFDTSAPSGVKLAVRLIAGVIARRIVPYVKQGDGVLRGDRICLIQFGSRADVYLPLDAKIQIKLGDHVVGGQTILAKIE